MKQYLVGVMYYGAIDSEHKKSMEQFIGHPRIKTVAEIGGCPYIDIGRASLAALTLATADVEGLIFVDHDIVFSRDAIDQLVESLDATEAIVGAGYSMRSPGSKMIGGIDTSKSDKPVIFFQGGGLYPAHYLGMGFTGIHRTAFEKIGKDLPFLDNGVTSIPIQPFFALLQEDGKYYGEDVSFCLRAQRAGVPIHMDTRIRVYHKGSYCYGLEDCGIVVPYLHQIQGVMKDDPQAMLSQCSPHPEIQRAIDASVETPGVVAHAAPPASSFPESIDPLAASSAA
jgi:hypothetical protein